VNGHAAPQVFSPPDPTAGGSLLPPAHYFQQPEPPPPQPPPAPYQATNLFLHGYRQLTEQQAHALRSVKDLALMLFRQLHALEGSALDEPDFNSRELQQAGLRLEESLLWVEKHFNV